MVKKIIKFIFVCLIFLSYFSLINSANLNSSTFITSIGFQNPSITMNYLVEPNSTNYLFNRTNIDILSPTFNSPTFQTLIDNSANPINITNNANCGNQCPASNPSTRLDTAQAPNFCSQIGYSGVSSSTNINYQAYSTSNGIGHQLSLNNWEKYGTFGSNWRHYLQSVTCLDILPSITFGVTTTSIENYFGVSLTNKNLTNYILNYDYNVNGTPLLFEGIIYIDLTNNQQSFKYNIDNISYKIVDFDLFLNSIINLTKTDFIIQLNTNLIDLQNVLANSSLQSIQNCPITINDNTIYSLNNEFVFDKNICFDMTNLATNVTIEGNNIEFPNSGLSSIIVKSLNLFNGLTIKNLRINNMLNSNFIYLIYTSPSLTNSNLDVFNNKILYLNTSKSFITFQDYFSSVYTGWEVVINSKINNNYVTSYGGRIFDIKTNQNYGNSRGDFYFNNFKLYNNDFISLINNSGDIFGNTNVIKGILWFAGEFNFTNNNFVSFKSLRDNGDTSKFKFNTYNVNWLNNFDGTLNPNLNIAPPFNETDNVILRKSASTDIYYGTYDYYKDVLGNYPSLVTISNIKEKTVSYPLSGFQTYINETYYLGYPFNVAPPPQNPINLIINNPTPLTTFNLSTNNVILNLSTFVNSTCSYNYNSITKNFNNTGGKIHTQNFNLSNISNIIQNFNLNFSCSAENFTSIDNIQFYKQPINLNIFIDTPLQNKVFTFDEFKFDLNLTTDKISSCSYSSQNNLTIFNNTNSLNHNSNIFLPIATTNNQNLVYDITCNYLNFNFSKILIISKSQIPFSLDILIPMNNQIFNSQTSNIEFSVFTNYQSNCYYKQNNETNYSIFTNTGNSNHFSNYSINNNQLLYNMTFFCDGIILNTNFSKNINFYIEQLITFPNNLYGGGNLTKTTTQLPQVGKDVGGFLSNLAPSVAEFMLNFAIITLIVSMVVVPVMFIRKFNK